MKTSEMIKVRRWDGVMVDEPTVKGKEISRRDGVRLIRQSPPRFNHRGGSWAVVYGLQVKEGLTRADAAREYGECIMHAMECEGRFD
jgi:hypothetical protein